MIHKKWLIPMAVLTATPVFAQTNVTLSGKINAAWEWSQAKGATHGPSRNIKMRDRMIESGSEIHMKATEDLGNGNTAFVDIQTAIDIFNSNDVATSNAGRLGSRRGAIGLRGNWGELMVGKWDIYENSMSWGGTEGAPANQSMNARSILNMVGGKSYAQTGCRCDNTIRYITPNISGFEVAIAYTRNGKGENGGELTWDPGDQNKVDRAYSVQARYRSGGLRLMAAFWNRQNAQGGIGVQSAGHRRWNSDYASAAGFGLDSSATLRDELSYKVGIGYAFDMGLTIAANYDYSQTKHKFVNKDSGELNGEQIKLRRHSWTIPIVYKTGPHQFHLAYGQAGKLKDWDDTGAQFWGVSYAYSLSKRTALYGGYAHYKNDRYATYDMWSSSGLGLSGTHAGADPTTFMVGMIHSF